MNYLKRGRCPHPASGIRLGFSGNTTNAEGIRSERSIHVHAAVPALFYRYWLSLSPKRTISWFSTWSQLRYLWVHFFITFSLARYSIFSSAISLGNTLFVFVTFRYCRFKPSIILVVLSRKRYSTTYTDKKTIPTFLGIPADKGDSPEKCRYSFTADIKLRISSYLSSFSSCSLFPGLSVPAL